MQLQTPRCKLHQQKLRAQRTSQNNQKAPHALPHLDGKHTVFGETTEGQDIIDSIKGGDLIKEIVIHGTTDELFKAHEDRITDWAI